MSDVKTLRGTTHVKSLGDFKEIAVVPVLNHFVPGSDQGMRPDE